MKLSQIMSIFQRKKVKPRLELVETDFHKISLAELESKLSTSTVEGLNPSNASQLLAKYGKNKITQARKNPLLKIVGYLFSGFCGLIWVAAIVCILAWRPIGDPSDSSITNLALGILLIFVILLQAAFTAFQDWSSNKVMSSIKNMMPSAATVIRGGKETKIPVDELVVGDLVCLQFGQKVPADVRLVESRDLKFDKSMLTGESEEIEGAVECTDDNFVESKNIGYMTTLITNGQGKGIVIFTGDHTVIGKLSGLTSATGDKETLLQKELKRFVIIVGCLAVFMGAVVIITWSTWLRVQYPNYITLPMLLVNTISVMIAFIPEGLPICVTLSLLVIAKRMAKSRVLVKNLSVIETLSCVNLIASDKTGTLTQNKMFVTCVSDGAELVRVDDAASSKSELEKSRSMLQLVAACGLCNNATFDDPATNDAPENIRQRKANGDATDVALLKFSAEFANLDELNTSYTVVADIPFNSRNKWMTKILDSSEATLFDETIEPNTHLVLLKGAPEYLLKKASRINRPDGTPRPLTDSDVAAIQRTQNEWCQKGQRVLLICKKGCRYADVSAKFKNISDFENYIHESNDFCLIGLVGIIDPPREGISDVIAKCNLAGIRVFMVTGDYAITAAAIAQQIGIFTQAHYDTIDALKRTRGRPSAAAPREAEGDGDSHTTRSTKKSLLLTGGDLINFKSEDWRRVTKYDEVVFARTTPEQKLIVVREFQQDGFTVGVTGDGVNDAPALKRADIGIAMGSGSEVAMEAAQLILLDNNFASILIAIKNGRLVFRNLRKVILYLLPGGCMGELIPTLMSIFLGVPQNLSSFQMIVISLFTDIAPSLSLMMEQQEVDLLAQPPRSKKDHLVDWKFMLQAYVFLGCLNCLFSQAMFFIYMNLYAGLAADQILFSFGNFLGTANFTTTVADVNATYIAASTATIDYAANREHFYTGQTVTFISLVLLQLFGNLLSTKTHIRSFFQQVPWRRETRNLWVYGAQLVSLSIMFIVVYVPVFQSIFNTRPVPASMYFMPLCFCLVVFALDETRKLLARNKLLFFHKFAW